MSENGVVGNTELNVRVYSVARLVSVNFSLLTAVVVLLLVVGGGGVEAAAGAAGVPSLLLLLGVI